MLNVDPGQVGRWIRHVADQKPNMPGVCVWILEQLHLAGHARSGLLHRVVLRTAAVLYFSHTGFLRTMVLQC